MELSKKSDFSLIKEIKKNNSNDAYLELKKRYEKLYYSTAASYCRKVKQLDYDSLVQDVDLVILKAINSYKTSKKTKVGSWICSHGRYHVLNTIRRENELGKFISCENKDLDILNTENRNVHIDTSNDLKNHIHKLLSEIKDGRAKTIIELRYFSSKEDSKWKNISKKLNLSTQQVLNIYNSCIKTLYKRINNYK